MLIEIVFVGFAIWTIFDTGAMPTAWIFGGMALLHYMISYDRIAWLVRQ